MLMYKMQSTSNNFSPRHDKHVLCLRNPIRMHRVQIFDIVDITSTNLVNISTASAQLLACKLVPPNFVYLLINKAAKMYAQTEATFLALAPSFYMHNLRGATPKDLQASQPNFSPRINHSSFLNTHAAQKNIPLLIALCILVILYLYVNRAKITQRFYQKTIHMHTIYNKQRIFCVQDAWLQRQSARGVSSTI